MMRTAISPRLAMRMRRIFTPTPRRDAQQHLAVFHQCAILRQISATVPRVPARTVFMSFMTSMMPTMVSSATTAPTST